jgi:hypothetical protein
LNRRNNKSRRLKKEKSFSTFIFQSILFTYLFKCKNQLIQSIQTFIQLFQFSKTFSTHIMEENKSSEAERSNQRRNKNRQSTEFLNEANNPCSKVC